MRVLICLLGVLCFHSLSNAQSTFIVTNSGDESDSDIEDNIFEPKTLRSAIENANLTPGKDFISFLGVERISLTGSLPLLIYPIEINGRNSITTRIIIDGGSIAGEISEGIVIRIGADFSKIHNVSLVNFSLGALRLAGNSATIDSVFIGTADGVSAEPNGDQFVPQNTPAVYIRGDYNEIKNSVISGNFGHGIRFNPYSDSMNVGIEGNIIGLDSSGTNKLSNASHGILISNGAFFIDDNTISGNDWNGVVIEGVESENFESRFEVNRIGLSKAANKSIGNTGNGIEIHRNNIKLEFNKIGGNGIGISIIGNWCELNFNEVGTTEEVLKDFGNTQAGLSIEGSNTIIFRNIISANHGDGIIISSSDNIIDSNIIGLTADGDSVLGNHRDGIEIQSDSPTSNEIRNNTISGNLFAGIEVYGSNSFTIIENNYIGTDSGGVKGLGNSGSGISLIDVANILIGPVETEKGNVISGNGQFGIFSGVTSFVDSTETDIQIYENKIGVDKNGSQGIGNLNSGIYLDNNHASIEYNIISANYNGISLNGHSAEIKGNRIGTDITGNNPIGNQRFGIELRGDSTTIGSTFDDSDRNIISANGIVGLLVYSDYNTISRNYIGTNSDAEDDLGNGDDGIRFLLNSTDNEVTDNVIMGNDGNGIKLFGKNYRFTITGNGIGVDLSETEFAMNDGSGIVIQNSDDIFLGLPNDNDRNFISSNGRYGVEIIGQVDGIKEGIFIRNNSIGDFDNGEEPNLEGGIYINEASNIYIGDEYGSDFENVISGNEFDGIFITDLNTGNEIETDSIYILGNFIGYDRDADSLGNKANGIRVDAGKNIFLGTESTDYINEIGNNGENGLLVNGDSEVYVGVNHFSNNINLGIDLGNDGVTENDTADVDAGPNGFLNFPIIDDANYNEVTEEIEVNARIISTTQVSNDYGISFYISEACDESGFGEGNYFLGSFPVELNDQGVAVIALNMDDSESEAEFEDYKSLYLTAITQKNEVGSSEFSQCFFVPLTAIAENVPDLILTKTDSLETIVGTDVIPKWRYTITAKNIGAIPATGIEITDTLNANLILTDTTFTHGQISVSENIVIAYVEEILPGDSVIMFISVETNAKGEVINSAYVSMNEVDPSPENNYDSDTTEVFIEVSDELIPDHPEKFSLDQNYPNPFNPSTNINFSVAEISDVEIKIYNSIGIEVATFVQAKKAPGKYSINWDASNFASGLYIYKMVAGSFTSTKKMILIK